jgi:nitroreductase
MMDFAALSAARYSVRKFKEIPVKKKDLDCILEAARNAPTASNRQPQRILVITKEEGLRKIDRCTKCRFGAPLVLLVCADTEAAWVRPFDKAKSSEVDASIITTQMMLQAADIGLGTTWVMYFDPAKTVEEFHLPANFLPVAMLILGYPAEDASPSERHVLREPLEKTVFYENFP